MRGRLAGGGLFWQPRQKAGIPIETSVLTVAGGKAFMCTAPKGRT